MTEMGVCRNCASGLSLDAPSCPRCHEERVFLTCPKCGSPRVSGVAAFFSQGKEYFSCGACGKNWSIPRASFVGNVAEAETGGNPFTRDFKSRWLVVPGLLLLLIILVSQAFNEPESEAQRIQREWRRAQAEAERIQEEFRITVAVWCEDAVRAQLKAPSTADFPVGNYSSVVIAGDTLARLQSYVDAQNSFGAIIRSGFLCTAKKGAGGRWTVRASLSD